MHWFKLMLLMLPAFGGPGDETVAVNVTDGVNQTITMAASAAEAYEPAWEIAVRSELADSPRYADELVGAISLASEETGVDPAMIWSVAWTETHGRHCRDNGKVKRGSAGEVGLMQIKPFWSKALKRKHGIEVDLFNLADNVRAGAHILARGGDSPSVMLSYYNTGQKLKSTPYQRKVMKYWKSIDEVPAKLDLKNVMADAKPAKAAKPAAAKDKPAAAPAKAKAPQAEAKPGKNEKAGKNDKSEKTGKNKPEDKDAPPNRSFRPE